MMKKPPDILKIPEWFDKSFPKNINFPDKNKVIPITSIINSEKVFLKNDFSNFTFINKKVVKNNDELYMNQINKIKENNLIDNKKKLIKLKTLETKHKKQIKFQNSVTKSIKISVDFNSTQRKKIFKWFKVCDKVYNYCVKDFNNFKNKNDWIKDNINYLTYKLDVFKGVFNDKNKNCPYDVLTDEVRVFCSNIKSCESNLKNHNIYKYTVRPRNNTLKIKSILIPSKSISKNGIFSTLLGKNNQLINKYIGEDIDVVQDSRLVYNKKLNTFVLNLVRKENIQYTDNKKEFICIDPGERIFNSYFASDSYGFLGKDLHKIYLKIRDKISRWTRILKNDKNEDNESITNKSKIKQRIQNFYEKIKNITKEMHNKISIYLCQNYKRIIIPEFKVSQMIDDKKRFVKRTIKELKEETSEEKKHVLLKKLKEVKKENRLSRKVKFVLLSQSHYKFKQHLINKCNEYGCELEIVTEEHTSVTCCKCGIMSNKYENRIKDCDCGNKINRDVNGSINIFHKNHTKILRRNVKVGTCLKH
jgi:IS605 OrfB family transposase